MRLHKVLSEYKDRVRLRIRPFPLGLEKRSVVPRDILEQEWWLAALQEPAAKFAPYEGDDWPATTLPALKQLGAPAAKAKLLLSIMTCGFAAPSLPKGKTSVESRY